MTTKQIADSLGKPEKTVRTWAAKAAAKSAAMTAKLAASSSTHPADYDLDETLAIIATGLGRNAAAVWLENAERAATPNQVGIDPAAIAAIVRETVAALVPAMVSALRGAPVAASPTPRGPLALPAPAKLEPRGALRKIVESWARSRGGGRAYHEAWANLYREYGYRYHRDIARAAKNHDQTVLEYAEAEGIVGELLALAYFLYGQERASA